MPIHKKNNNPKLLTLASALSILILALLYLNITVSIPSYHQTHKPKTFVTFISNTGQSTQKSLQEQSILLDTQSIFLPSKWSASSETHLSEKKDPLFQDFPPYTCFNKNPNPLAFLNSPSNKTPSPTSTLNYNPSEYLQHFSRKQPQINPLLSRAARISIQSLNNNHTPILFTLPQSNSFPQPQALWKPTQYLLLITQTCTPPNPLKITSSSNEDIDAFFSNNLTSMPIIQNLIKGYYLVTISP